jgi:hypothetical protein
LRAFIPPAPSLDRSRIDLTNPGEVAWWCATLGVSERQLHDAVEAAGPEIGAVRTELGQGRD